MRGGGLVELVGLKRRRNFPAGLCGLVRDPAVERLLGVVRIEIGIVRATVDLGETRGVPELGGKTSVAGDTLHIELDIAALRRHRGEREAQGIGAVLVDQFQRVDDVALRLRHLRAAGVAHQRVDVDRGERHLVHEMQAHHHHARDPEEDDVEAGDEHAGRVIAFQLRRLVGPAERRERPQRRREPGVEHVLVAVQVLVGKPRAPRRIGGDVMSILDRDLLDIGVVGKRFRDRVILAFRDEDFAVGPVPGRNLMAPPDLPRDAPGLDVLHPVEERRLPLRRHERSLAFAHRGDRRLAPASWRRRTIDR